MPIDKETIELALVAVAALALLVQTIFLLVLLAKLNKVARDAREEFQELRSSIMPIIYNTREIIARVAPKIEAAADELAALTDSLHEQTAEVRAAASEMLGRAQHITVRIDSMATNVLDNIERAAGFVTDTVARPVRQVSGVFAAIRAVVESLRDSEFSFRTRPMSRQPGDFRVDDKDMFV